MSRLSEDLEPECTGLGPSVALVSRATLDSIYPGGLLLGPRELKHRNKSSTHSACPAGGAHSG